MSTDLTLSWFGRKTSAWTDQVIIETRNTAQPNKTYSNKNSHQIQGYNIPRSVELDIDVVVTVGHKIEFNKIGEFFSSTLVDYIK